MMRSALGHTASHVPRGVAVSPAVTVQCNIYLNNRGMCLAELVLAAFERLRP